MAENKKPAAGKEPIEQDKKQKIIYGVLLAIGIMGIVGAASRAELIATWISGWSK